VWVERQFAMFSLIDMPSKYY